MKRALVVRWLFLISVNIYFQIKYLEFTLEVRFKAYFLLDKIHKFARDRNLVPGRKAGQSGIGL